MYSVHYFIRLLENPTPEPPLPTPPLAFVNPGERRPLPGSLDVPVPGEWPEAEPFA